MFIDQEEKKLSEEFLKKGYIVKNISDVKSLKKISGFVENFCIKKFKPKNKKDIFNNLHKFLKVKDLNDYRVSLYNHINKYKDFREFYYSIAKDYLNILVGNELVMQNKVNLSIQFPKDSSSLLPLHSDTWSGDSPFEIVVWLPLVDCYKTKSMFILNPKKSKNLYKDFSKKNKSNTDQIFNSIKKDLTWINIKYGQILIFNQSLPHGNIVNKENETRISLNCRFKSLFSPYGDKKLGEFFEPIIIRPATKIGIDYKDPE
jgi:sporadic carbohydrate cluster 2OG-Fe(II) oxygenase